MKNITKRAAVTGILAGTIALGGAGIAMAAVPSTAGGAATSIGQQDPSYTGSVAAPADTSTGGKATEQSQAGESAALQSLAKISPDQASAAALAAVPGTAGTVQLEDENGFVVYGIEVTRADGTVTDVKVDAGNGTVLAQEADGTGEGGPETSGEGSSAGGVGTGTN